MARYKVLQSVAHSLAHSFTSLMHYLGDDYAMGHLVEAARATRQPTLLLDLMTGTGAPATLLEPPLTELPAQWASELRRLIANHGSAMEYVHGATLSLHVDISRERPWSCAPNLIESPYRCEVVLTDDRGKEWRTVLEGWWAPEGGNPDVDPGPAPLRRPDPHPPGRPWWHFW